MFHIPGKFKDKISDVLNEPKHIAPLAILRIAFGTIMFISIIRFILKGWIYDFYIAPKFFFTFYGFDWVKPVGAIGMYALFGIMVLASLGIIFGLFYRISVTAFFASFVYVELIDKTNYLNHYYFISIFTFLMMLAPANRYLSLDVLRKSSLKVTTIPAWIILIFKFQLIIVYFFAGLSKLTNDWLLEAMPLKIWLPGNYDLPIIGSLLTEEWVAYLFSWFGALFDLFIGFFLLHRRTTIYAYCVVVVFHVFTGWLFNIGIFPYIMIFATIIFFPEDFHRKLIEKIQQLWRSKPSIEIFRYYELPNTKFIYSILIIYFSLQLTLPFRYLLYPGELFWTEEGYRFSWRVMLMEKGGTLFFYVKDPETGRVSEINNSVYLTLAQEKMMTTQPDMILQFAHFLENEYRSKGIKDPIVTVESYVTLNGSGSRLFIDQTVDLTHEEESLLPKNWILPFKK